MVWFCRFWFQARFGSKSDQVSPCGAVTWRGVHHVVPWREDGTSLGWRGAFLWVGWWVTSLMWTLIRFMEKVRIEILRWSLDYIQYIFIYIYMISFTRWFSIWNAWHLQATTSWCENGWTEPHRTNMFQMPWFNHQLVIVEELLAASIFKFHQQRVSLNHLRGRRQLLQKESTS